MNLIGTLRGNRLQVLTRETILPSGDRRKLMRSGLAQLQIQQSVTKLTPLGRQLIRGQREEHTADGYRWVYFPATAYSDPNSALPYRKARCSRRADDDFHRFLLVSTLTFQRPINFLLIFWAARHTLLLIKSIEGLNRLNARRRNVVAILALDQLYKTALRLDCSSHICCCE
jgi:hypothetical protein